MLTYCRKSPRSVRVGKRDRASFWVKLLKKDPECSSGEGPTSTWDLWPREHRWGVWCPVYSYLGGRLETGENTLCQTSRYFNCTVSEMWVPSWCSFLEQETSNRRGGLPQIPPLMTKVQPLPHSVLWDFKSSGPVDA